MELPWERTKSCRQNNRLLQVHCKHAPCGCLCQNSKETVLIITHCFPPDPKFSFLCASISFSNSKLVHFCPPVYSYWTSCFNFGCNVVKYGFPVLQTKRQRAMQSEEVIFLYVHESMWGHIGKKKWIIKGYWHHDPLPSKMCKRASLPQRPVTYFFLNHNCTELIWSFSHTPNIQRQKSCNCSFLFWPLTEFGKLTMRYHFKF